MLLFFSFSIIASLFFPLALIGTGNALPVKNEPNLLVNAAKTGNLDLVIASLKTATPALKNQASFEAARFAHFEIVKVLVKNGASPEEALIGATMAIPQQLQIVKYLLENGADPVFEALENSVKMNYIDSVRILLAKGADPSLDDNSLILDTLERRNIQMAGLLSSYGADPSTQENIALEFASSQGHKDVVAYLLGHHMVLRSLRKDPEQIDMFILGARTDEIVKMLEKVARTL